MMVSRKDYLFCDKSTHLFTSTTDDYILNRKGKDNNCLKNKSNQYIKCIKIIRV